MFKRYANLSLPLKASFWFLAAGVVQKAISILVTPIFTRIMSQGDFGAYTLYVSWLDLTAVFVTLRLSWGGFMQGLVQREDERDAFTSVLVGLSIVLEVLAFLLCGVFHRPLERLTGLSPFLIACAIASVWLIELFEFWSARQRVDFRYRGVVLVGIVVAVATPSLGVAGVLLFPSAPVEARVGSTILVQGLAYCWIAVSYLKKGRRFVDAETWRSALDFNLPLVPHYVSEVLLNQSSRLLVGRLVGPVEAGIYGLGNSLALIMTIVNQALNSVFQPWVFQKIKASSHNEVARVGYLCIALVAAANLIVVAFAPEAINFFAPVEYRDAVWVVPPLAACTLLMFAYTYYTNFDYYFGETRLVMVASVCGALANIAINFLFISALGWIWAAYASCISYFLFVVLHYLFADLVCRRNIGQGVPLRLGPVMLLVIFFAVGAFVFTLCFPWLGVRIGLVALLACAVWTQRKRVFEAVRATRETES